MFTLPTTPAFRRTAARFVMAAAAFVVAGYLGLWLLFPTPDIEPVQPEASDPFGAGFTITNPSPFLTMRNAAWFCVMRRLEQDPQVPILDFPQLRDGPRGTDIPPKGSECHTCYERAGLRREGTYDVSLSVDYETPLEVLSIKWALKRTFSRDGLTWRIDQDGGRWVE